MKSVFLSLLRALILKESVCLWRDKLVEAGYDTLDKILAASPADFEKLKVLQR